MTDELNGIPGEEILENMEKLGFGAGPEARMKITVPDFVTIPIPASIFDVPHKRASHVATVISRYIAANKDDSFTFSNDTCSCSMDYASKSEIPSEDVLCECGNYLLKFEKAGA